MHRIERGKFAGQRGKGEADSENTEPLSPFPCDGQNCSRPPGRGGGGAVVGGDTTHTHTHNQFIHNFPSILSSMTFYLPISNVLQ